MIFSTKHLGLQGSELLERVEGFLQLPLKLLHTSDGGKRGEGFLMLAPQSNFKPLVDGLEMRRCCRKLLLGFEVKRECPETNQGLGVWFAKAANGALVRFGAEFVGISELANVFQKIGIFVQRRQGQGIVRTQHLLQGAEGFLIKLVRFLKVAHLNQELGLVAKGEFHQAWIVGRKGVLCKEEHFGGNRECLLQISFLIKLFNLRLKLGKLLQRVRGAVLGNSGQGQAGEEQEADGQHIPPEALTWN